MSRSLRLFAALSSSLKRLALLWLFAGLLGSSLAVSAATLTVSPQPSLDGSYQLQWSGARTYAAFYEWIDNDWVWLRYSTGKEAITYPVSGKAPGQYRYKVVDIFINAASQGSTHLEDHFVTVQVGIPQIPPVISAPSLSSLQESTQGSFTFTVSDADTPLSQLHVTASSSNTSLVGVTVSGGNGSYTLQLNVNRMPNETVPSSSATVTLQVANGSSQPVTHSIALTINDAPARFVAPIPSTSNTGIYTLSWSEAKQFARLRESPDGVNWTSLGEQSPDGSLTLTRNRNGTFHYQLEDCYYAGGSPQCVVTDTRQVIVAIPAPSMTLAFTPTVINEGDSATFTWDSVRADTCTVTGISAASGKSGSPTYTAPASMASNMTVRATVTCTGAGGSISDYRDLTVNWVNDTPIAQLPASVNATEDTLIYIPLTVSDEETAPGNLTFAVTSSDAGKILPANVQVDLANARLVATPMANASGPVTLTLKVTDAQGAFTTASSTVQLAAVDDPLTIGAIGNITLTEHTSKTSNVFSITDIDSVVGTVSINSSVPALVSATVQSLGNSQYQVQVTAGKVIGNQPTSAALTVQVSGSSVTRTFGVSVTDILATFATGIPASSTSTTGDYTLSWSGAQQFARLRESPDGVNWTSLGEQSPDGSLTLTRNRNGTFHYQLEDCYYAGGGANGNPQCVVTDTRQVIVAIPAPSMTLAFTPTAINEGGSATFTWDSVRADTCTVTGISAASGKSGSPTYTAPTSMASNMNVRATVVCTGPGGSVSDFRDLTVNWINDTPIAQLPASVNATEDTLVYIPLTVSDEETAPGNLAFTVTSSDAGKILPANVQVDLANARLVVTPVANANGPVTLTLKVTDAQGAVATASTTVQLAAVDDPLTIDAIGDITLAEETSKSSNVFKITDIDSAMGTISISSTLPALASATVQSLGNSNYQVQVTAGKIVGNQPTYIILTLQVSGSSLTRTFGVNVTDIPATFATSIPTSSTSTNGDYTLSWSGAKQFARLRESPDGVNWTSLGEQSPNGSLTLTKQQNGTFHYQLEDCYYAGGGANGSPQCVVTDTRQVIVAFTPPFITACFRPTVFAACLSPAVINESPNAGPANSVDLTWSVEYGLNCSAIGSLGALSGLSGNRSYTAPTQLAANQTLEVIFTCNGKGPSTVHKTISLTVNAVNDAPTAAVLPAQSISEDGTTGPLALGLGDEETPASLTISNLTSNNTTLLPLTGLTISGSGASQTLTVTPAANQFGSATIGYRVNDGQGGTVDRAFVVNVASVNDAPGLTVPTDQRIEQNTSTAVLDVTVSDLETPATNLTLTASSDKPTLVDSSGITLSGSGANRTVKVTPKAGQSGLANITLTVSDGQPNGTYSKSFKVSVQPQLAAFNPVTDTPALFNYALTGGITDVGTDQFVAITQGKLAVNNGAAQYSVPLVLPPAVRDLVPNLSLAYNSRSGQGLAGLGWNLSGLSAITRCRASVATEGAEAQKSNPRYSTGDRLCLDGQKLEVATSTTPATDTSYWTTGTEYRTEIDSFAKVVSYGSSAKGGHEYFKVWTKDGRILTFGREEHSQNSRIYAPGLTNTPSTDPVSTWALDKVEDNYGNSYTITYTRDTTNGEYYPAYIRFSPDAAVVFSYIDNPGTIPWGYDAGQKYSSRKLLEKITTYINATNASIPSVGATAVRQYDLDHEVSPTTGRSLIKQITECGYTGSTPTCAKPLIFTWQAGEVGFDSTPQPIVMTDSSLLQEFSGFEDVDGDGYTDIPGVAWGQADGRFRRLSTADTRHLQVINTRHGKAAVRLDSTVLNLVTFNAATNTEATTPIATLSTPGAVLEPLVVTRDINNDGLTDLMTQKVGEYYTTLWLQVNDTGATRFSVLPTPGPYIHGVESDFRDVNADGLEDLSFVSWSLATAPGATNYLAGFTNHGSGFTTTVTWGGRVSQTYQTGAIPGSNTSPGGSRDMPVPSVLKLFVDINNDGHRDILYQTASPDANQVQQPVKWTVELGTGKIQHDAPQLDTGINVARLDNALHTNPNYAFSSQYSFTHDYNKDGYQDLIVLQGSPNAWVWRLFYNRAIQGTQTFTDSGIDPFFGNSTYLAYQPIFQQPRKINPFRGDVNNDGIPDLTYATNPNGGGAMGYVYYAGKTRQPDLLTRVTDGFGVQTKLAYSPLSTATNNGEALYTPDATAPSFPYAPVNRATQVVTKLSASNGAGGFNDVYYHYSGGKQHLLRGFAGFSSIKTTNAASGVQATATYRQDWPFTGRIATQLVKDSVSGKLISASNNTYAIHSSNARYPYLQATVQQRYELMTTHEGAPLSVSRSVNTPNACGNPVTTAASTGTGLSGGVDITGEIARQQTDNVYDEGVASDCSDDFLTQSTQTVAKAYGADPKTVVTRFTANPQRDIATRTDFAGTAIERTTTYGRETNGVINSVSEVAKDIDGTSLPARATLYSGFTDGLYAGTVTNAKGHTATLTYEKRTGSLKSQTRNPMALTTHTYVDALGRTMTQKGEDGVVTDTIGFYCTNVPAGIVCPTGAVYGVATKVTHTAAANQLGAPLAIAFYDALQRPIRSVRFSLDGKVINQATEYNSLGQVTRVSEPYTTVGVQADTTAASAWTTYSDYDALGRPNILIGADNGSKTLSYSTDTLGLKVTEDVIVLTPSSSSDTQTTTRTLNALGQVVNVQDALSNTVSYQYDALGNLQTTQVNNNTATTISISHDLAGNKIAITDPDAGAISFAYNGHGELRKQTWQPGTGDAKSITWAYDLLGRQTTRTDTPASGTAISYSWLWDTLYPGELTQREGNGLKEEYRYDSKLRLNKQTITADSVNRGDFTYLYDAFSRPTEEKYPGGFKVKRDYHAAGYQVKTSDITTAASPKTLWTLGNHIDGRGNFSQQLWGNGVVTQTTFNQTSGQLKSIRSGRLSANNPINNLNGDIQNLSYTFDTLGNLYSRSTQRTDNNGLPYEEIKEAFGYDKLNRLTQSTTTGGVFGRTQTFAYDAGGLGNLTSRTDMLTGNDANTGNNDVGTLTYGRVRNAGIHAVTSAGGLNYGYDKYGNMTTRGSETLTYNVFNKPTRITGSTTTDFTYGPDDELYKEVSGGITTYRFAGGIYELIVNGTTTAIQKSYVDGVILNTRTLTNNVQTANTTQYLHTDHLGSVEATTDALGKFVNRMSFSTWGERQTNDWQPGTPTETFATTNGFTGHDQVDQHKLIHMGGRVYDPNLGRFLSADLYIQSPYNTQSFNRYSYTFNSPLSHTDPSGYWTINIFGCPTCLYGQAAINFLTAWSTYSNQSQGYVNGHDILNRNTNTAYEQPVGGSLATSMNAVSEDNDSIEINEDDLNKGFTGKETELDSDKSLEETEKAAEKLWGRQVSLVCLTRKAKNMCWMVMKRAEVIDLVLGSQRKVNSLKAGLMTRSKVKYRML